MRTTPLTAALALTLAAAAAGAQQPTSPTSPTTPTSPAPTAPSQPDSGMMRDSAMRGMPRPGMMQDSMARRGTMQDSAGMRARSDGMGMRRGTRGMRGMQATDTALVAQLDSVNTAAKSDLTSLPASVAVPLIQSIETKLRASGSASLRSIASDLALLRAQLGMSTVNGARVGTILRRVGPKVTRVSAGQSGALRTTLAEIGRELTAAGRRLSAAR